MVYNTMTMISGNALTSECGLDFQNLDVSTRVAQGVCQVNGVSTYLNDISVECRVYL